MFGQTFYPIESPSRTAAQLEDDLQPHRLAAVAPPEGLPGAGQLRPRKARVVVSMYICNVLHEHLPAFCHLLLHTVHPQSFAV